MSESLTLTGFDDDSMLVDSLNQTYFLHLLVNDKNKVVPPGKSVISMLMHVNFRLRKEDDSDARQNDLVERVKAAAHKAFWRDVNSIFLVMFPHFNCLFRQ